MFSKMARSMPRGIRVASKQELIDRIHIYFQHMNADPVIFRWELQNERDPYWLIINRTIIQLVKLAAVEAEAGEHAAHLLRRD
jgi:hypothetical protein